jgi:hypothetical protein
VHLVGVLFNIILYIGKNFCFFNHIFQLHVFSLARRGRVTIRCIISRLTASLVYCLWMKISRSLLEGDGESTISCRLKMLRAARGLPIVL